jgi:hypothetical protein
MHGNGRHPCLGQAAGHQQALPKASVAVLFANLLRFIAQRIRPVAGRRADHLHRRITEQIEVAACNAAPAACQHIE